MAFKHQYQLVIEGAACRKGWTEWSREWTRPAPDQLLMSPPEPGVSLKAGQRCLCSAKTSCCLILSWIRRWGDAGEESSILQHAVRSSLSFFLSSREISKCTSLLKKKGFWKYLWYPNLTEKCRSKLPNTVHKVYCLYRLFGVLYYCKASAVNKLLHCTHPESTWNLVDLLSPPEHCWNAPPLPLPSIRRPVETNTEV